MTISTTNITKSYNGNGSTHSFAYDFPIFADADLTVIVRSSTGTESTKTLNTHFIVTGAGSSSGGTVLFKFNTGTSTDAHYSLTDQRPASGENVVIRSELGNTQTLDLVANDPFPASSFETALDRLVRMVQQHDEELDRSIKLSRTNTMTSTEFTTSATDRASKILAFDSSGEISVAQELGTFKGNSATTTTAAFVQRDIVKATTTAQLNNIYICVADSAVGDALTDTNHWALLVDAVSAASSATNAANSATAAATDADDADKIVNTNFEVQYTLSNGNTGYSALHYYNATLIQTQNAVTQAGLATNAKTDAEAAKTAAETALDLFDDAMLGAKASDPSLDNDGQALADGALYFDTTNDVMKVYNLATTSWLQLTPTVSNQVNINTVAGQVSPTNNIATVAGIDSEITTVAGINTTHLSNVSGVATEVGRLGTADAVADMNTLGTTAIVTDMDTLADRAADIATLADIQDGTTATNTMQTVVSNLTGVNNFFAQYRTGSSDPTTSLDEGDLFYNSTSNNLKYYNGSEWVVATTSVNGTANRNTYTATAGQTTFSATYDVGFVDVYLNGVKLIVSTDFTATNGTSIVLASGAALNDTVDIVGYGVFDVANVNFSINDATDVNTAGLSNGQILAFNSSTSDFEPVDANAGAALLAGSTFTGAVVVNNQLDIEEVHEKVTVITSTTGTLTFDTAVQGVVFGTANQTANRTINFTNVNSTLAVGQSVTCAVMLSQGSTAYYLSAYQVDSSAVTPKWQGGTAPSAGNASGIDAYSFTIIKTADATFTVLASQTQFA